METLGYEIFNNYGDSLKCAVFNREGGVSKPPYDSLNIRFGLGDEEDDVKENRRRICDFLGIGEKQLVSSNQVHGDKAIIVNEPPEKEFDGYDALITNKKGLFLMVQVADCQGVVIFDPAKEVIANIHCGWQGSVQNIIGKTIRKMKEEFGCDGNDLLIGVSPSLGPCHAEFSDPYKELPKHFHQYILENNHINFWKVTIDQCINEGVLKENIEVHEVCTICNEEYFSHRRDKGKSGRFAIVIGMS